ncbi:MAG: 2-C-methyl-D-erythritol 4-phosphate cytidylyltransferase [Pseudomonadales bacterium]|nr:2-C-methyl-D-erythritol 4-phosphate cytidylyltransferase [Pseudomonadales bacterium]
MSQPSIWAVVPAAGIGTRFAADRPKQYLSLAGQLIAERSLNTLESSDLFAAIVVAINPVDSYFNQLAAAALPLIERVDGGASRAESVLNGLKALSNRAEKDDWVMVHDIARPLVTAASLHRLRDAVSDTDVAAILAAPIYDTIKQVAVPDNEIEKNTGLPVVQATLDRRQLWVAQTPQMVRYGLLYKALSQALAADDNTVTDEASAVERLGADVVVVENTQKNIKITTADDLQMAAFFLSLR